MTLDELSKLSTIDINLLEKLDHVIKYIISDEIVHAVKNNKDVIDIELGQIGILTLNVSNTEVKYNFKPSDEFNKIVCNAIVKETNNLDKALECAIMKKFKDIYRDFF